MVACVRSPGAGRSRRAETREFETFIDDLERLRDWLVAEGVTHVAMEATGIYWKPVWFVLEDGGFELLLVNARNMRMVPGRKTDVADAGWIAQLLECGLLRGSLVPPPVIRELRDLTRYRKRLVQDRTREGQRVEKVLEDAGIKLASVASQTMSKSGRAMIDALVAGERNPIVLTDLAKKRMHSKIPQLQRALVGRFGAHHAAMLRLHLAHIDQLDALIEVIDEQLDAKLVPFADDLRRVQSITGVGPTTAQVLIAEIGVDMTAFPTAGHLASWCGVCPGNNESAGKQRSGRTNPASLWLTDALVQAAWAASRSRDTWLAEQCPLDRCPEPSGVYDNAASTSVATTTQNMASGVAAAPMPHTSRVKRRGMPNSIPPMAPRTWSRISVDQPAGGEGRICERGTIDCPQAPCPRFRARPPSIVYVEPVT